MNKSISKNFIIISLIVHILIIVLLLLITNSINSINKKFLVFGQHSKKPTQAYFKTLKSTSKSTNKWFNKRREEFKKQAEIKKAKQKKKQEAKKRSPIKKTNPKKIKNKTTKKAAAKPKVKNLKQKITKKNESSSIKKTNKLEQQSTPPKPSPEKNQTLNFNLIGETDPNLIRYQRQIQKEVERIWRPPLGVPKGTECILSFLINSKGNVKEFEFVKRSKVLIYNLSISRIAMKFKFDKTLWNKNFTVVFRQ